MKSRRLSIARLSFPLASAIAALINLTAPTAKAFTYYWDNNGATTGFGTAAGTWSSTGTVGSATQGWGTVAAGTTAPTGTITTTTADILNFGTSTNGLAAGTITVSGTVNAASLTFGTASGTVGFTGGTINLASGGTINDGGNTVTMDSALSGTGNIAFTGGGIVNFTASGTAGLGATFTATVSGGSTLKFSSGGHAALGGSSGYTINLGGATSAGTIAFGNSGTLANKITVVAGTGGRTITNTTSVSPGVSGAITANENLTISNTNTGTLTVSGTGSSVATGKVIAWNASGSGSLADSNTWSGLGSMTYTGGANSTLTVSGAKTYSGGATLNTMTATGEVVVSTSSAGPANAPTSGAFGTGTLSLGATRMRAATGGTDITIGNAITFTGAPVFHTIASEKSLIFTGNASLGASRIITVDTGATVAGKGVEFQGIISGSTFKITTAGTGGLLILSGANSYTGGTDIGGTTTLQLGNGTATGSLSTTGAITVATGATFAVKQSDTVTQGTDFSGAAITGAGSFSQTGTGTTILNAANSFSGGTTISAGTLVAGLSGNGTNSTLGSVSNTRTITVNTGGTLRADVGNIFSTSFATAASSLPTLAIAGGTMTNGGAATNSALGNITLTGGTLTATTGSPAGTASGQGFGSWNLNGTVTSTGTSTISSTAGAGIPITLNATNGLISPATIFDVTSGTLTASAVLGQVTRAGNETVGSLAKSGAGTMILSGNNTFTGGVTVNAGTLTLANAGALNSTAGSENAVAFGASSTGTLALGGNSVVIRSLSSNATPGTPVVENANAGNATLTIGNSLNLASSFAGVIQNGTGGGTLGLTKAGTNTLTLSGDNSYTGATLVSDGTLTLSGSGDINSTSGITVNGSGTKFLQTSSVAVSPAVTLTQGTLTGSGTVNTVNVGAGTGGIISNNNGVAGAALTIGNLTLAGAANLNLFSNSISSNLDVTGTLTTAATPATLTANNAGGWSNGITYTLLTFGGGAISGSGDNFTKVINNLVTRQSGTWNTTSSAITLTLAGDNPVWSGANGGTWTTEATNSPTSGTPNWALKNGLTATDFWVADIAEFNDTYDIGGGPVAPTTTTVDISSANVSPGATTFNNSALNYTLNSSGGFGIATGSLTKNGTGTLTINTANTYTGITTLNAGVLRATTNATSLGAGTLTLAGGELQLANDTGLNFGRNTTVSSNVQVTSDTLTAVAGVTHTLGTLSIGAQTLTIAKGANVASGTAGISFGATTLTGGSTFTIGTGALLTLGAVTNGANTAIITGAGNFAQTGVWGNGAGGITFDGSFSGLATLNQANSYTGITTLNGGILRATTSASALGAGTLALAGGELQLANDTSLNFGRNTTVTGNAQITSDTLTSVAGVNHTLGTLSIGGQTLTIAKGSNATGTTAGVTFGATTLTGAPTFSIGTGSALTLAAVTNAGNSITLTGAGNFSQTGALTGVGGLTLNSGFSGTATLSSASTNYSGVTTISGGKLVLASTTAFASAVTVNAGGTLQYSPTATSNQAGVGAISLLGTLTYAPAGNAFQVLGTSGANKIVTVSGGDSIINISPGGTFAASTGGLYLDGGLQGSSALTVNATTNGFGLILRNAGTTYSGTMTVNGNASTIAGTGSGLVIGFQTTSPAMLSANLTINGTLELGDSTSGMGWAAGTTTGLTFGMDALNGTGVIVGNMKTAASTRTISVGNNGGTGNFSGVIANGVNNTLSFIKAGSGTQTLSGLSATAANNYSGTTTVDNGTLAFTTTSPSLTGGLRFGSTATNTTPGILDLTTTSAAFTGALLVNTNSATASEIKIGAAQMLTFNGNVQIGATTPSVANTVTKLNMTGGGVLNVTTAAGGTFIVGGSSSTTLAQDTTLDLTALSAVTINTSTTGALRVNPSGATNLTGAKATLLLPAPVVADTVATATLTAGAIAVGNASLFNSQAGQINTLQLGTGLTTLNANTINVGTGARDIGQIIFGGAGGDVIIRAADGTSRATTFAIGTGGATTATSEATTNNLVDFSGHDVDILVTSLNVGNQARVGNLTSEFKFGAGTGSLASTLDATNVNIGFRTGTVTNTSVLTNRVNLSGGTVTFGNAGASGTGVDIGNSAYNGAGTASTVGELNISGGTVTIYNGSGGFAVRLGSNVAAGGGTVTASMNLTGGTTTLGGDIIRGATSPRTTSTLMISGGTLDMGGHDIGTGSLPINLITESGELRNVATINGSGGLTKTTGGTLIVSGTNGYTGGTTLTLGNIQIGSGSSLGSVNGSLTVTAGTLDVNGNDLGVGDFTGAGGTIVNNSIGTNKTLTIGNNDATGGDYAGVIADNSGTGGTLALTKTGNGTLTLSNANSYTGGTSINGGSLQIDHAIALGTTGTIAFGGGTLKYGTGIATDLSSRFSTAASQDYKIDTNGNDVTLGTGLDSTSGTLTKSGAGKLTIGTSAYTGATLVNGGTLAIDGNVSTAVTVNSGGTLGGNGSIGGSVTVLNGGTIAAGNSIESITTGALSLEAGSTLAYEIDNDAAAGVAGDLTAVTGNLTLDLANLTNLTLGELGAGTWTIGEKLTLISYSGTWNGGLFDYGGTLADDSTFSFSGMAWLFDYNDTAAGTNYTGDLTGSSFVTMTAVPEPNVAALISGVGVLALLRRRRS